MTPLLGGIAAVVLLAIVGFALARRKNVDPLQQGKALFESRQYDQAIEAFGRALDLNPNDADTLVWRGMSHAFLKAYEAAIADFDRALRIKPDHAAAYYNRGQAHEMLGHDDRAREDWRQALAHAPPNWPSRPLIEQKLAPPPSAEKLIELAMVHCARDDNDKAIEVLNQVLRLKPDSAPAHFYRGLAYLHKGDRVQALENYDRAIKLDPKHADAYNDRGNVYYAMGRMDRAIADYTRCIDLKSSGNPALALCCRANAYRGIDRNDKALEDLNRAIELNPNHAPAYFGRALLRGLAGDSDGAMSDYDRAIELNLEPPQDLASVHAMRGQIHHGQGRSDRAREDWRRALQIAPAGWPYCAEVQRNLTALGG